MCVTYVLYYMHCVGSSGYFYRKTKDPFQMSAKWTLNTVDELIAFAHEILTSINVHVILMPDDAKRNDGKRPKQKRYKWNEMKRK